MRTLTILMVLLIMPFISLCQKKIRDTIKNVDSADRACIDTNQKHDYYQYILRYHDPILYLTFAPLVRPLEKRITSLRQREGEEGYILEGNVTHRITLYRGKYYSSKCLQKLRITFDAAFNLRMTKDTSSPLLPQNNVIGLGADYLLSRIEKLQKNNKTSHWLKVQVHHFSNGQAGTPLFGSRNNYIDGDFSTNYIRLMGNSMYRSKGGNHLWSIGYGYQRDLDFFEPLTVSKHMWANYGFNRILVNLQWLLEPLYYYEVKEKNLSVINKRRQFMARAELDYIFGDGLGSYPYKNKSPLNTHLYLSYFPWVTTNFGFLFHGYVGRDYMNIRYDEPIYSAQLGLVMNFNQYVRRDKRL